MPSIRRYAAFILLFTTAVACARGTPRTWTGGIARAIERDYFDATRGRKIADGLLDAAKSGAFDGDTDPARLAAALTARLQPLDRHFRVIWPADDVARAGPRMRGPMRHRVPRGVREEVDATGIRTVKVLPGNIGYLALTGFADFEPGSTDQPARRAIDRALQHLSGTGAVIVDLRGNRGGSPHMVGYLVSAFVPPGADVYNVFHTRDAARSEAPLLPHAHPRTRVPLYVLIDAHTGSAAESFAYTLQSARRAVIVGETSGGAADPGSFVTTSDGFAVFVPTSSPVNPITHTNWEGRGVVPDVPVASAVALERALMLARRQVNAHVP